MFPWTTPYNLETLYEAWQDAPIFDGKTSNKDNVEVVTWLAKIAEGCNTRKVPKGLWHQVAQHYMLKKALDRLLEVEKVLKNFYGGKLSWNWERFKQAMISIRWSISISKMMSLRRVASTFKQIICKKEEPPTPTGVRPVNTNSQPFLKRTPTLKGLARNPSTSCKSANTTNGTTATTGKGFFSTSQTKSTSASAPANNKADKKQISTAKDAKKSASEAVSSVKATNKGSMKVQLFVPKPTDAATELIVNAPLWLIESCIALEELTSEYPKTMSMIAAALITIGAIPALPAVSAGAAGTVLASGAAHTIGSVAVAIGTMLAAQSQIQNEKSGTSKG